MDGFRGLQVINMITHLGAYLEHILLELSKAFLLLSVISVGFTVMTLFAMSSSCTSAEDAIKLVDISGWSDGVAFILGSSGASWCFSCLAVATHLA